MDEKSLIEIYNQASNFFYNTKINRTAKSKHWETLYNKNKFNIENLKNFRNSNSRLSRGLDSSSNNISFKLYAEVVEKVSEDYLLNNFSKDNIGNSDHLIPYKNIFLDTNKLIHIYWFWIIENKILKKIKLLMYVKLVVVLDLFQNYL